MAAIGVWICGDYNIIVSSCAVLLSISVVLVFGVSFAYSFWGGVVCCPIVLEFVFLVFLYIKCVKSCVLTVFCFCYSMWQVLVWGTHTFALFVFDWCVGVGHAGV